MKTDEHKTDERNFDFDLGSDLTAQVRVMQEDGERPMIAVTLPGEYGDLHPKLQSFALRVLDEQLSSGWGERADDDHRQLFMPFYESTVEGVLYRIKRDLTALKELVTARSSIAPATLEQAGTILSKVVQAIAKGPWPDDAPGDDPWSKHARHRARVRAGEEALFLCGAIPAHQPDLSLPYWVAALIAGVVARDVHPNGPGRLAPSMSPGLNELVGVHVGALLRRQSRRGRAVLSALREVLPTGTWNTRQDFLVLACAAALAGHTSLAREAFGAHMTAGNDTDTASEEARGVWALLVQGDEQ